ncbi:MAG: hypothetical protein WD875_10205 [Pirellulales bacterium]
MCGSRHVARKVDRKTLQFCAQVADTLNHVLSGECDDDVLRQLIVAHVAPAPNAGQLLVSVASAVPGEPLDVALVADKLSAATARLRRVVAESITRRRTPQLIFAVTPGGWDNASSIAANGPPNCSSSNCSS